jgi:hypothetical protein
MAPKPFTSPNTLVPRPRSAKPLCESGARVGQREELSAAVAFSGGPPISVGDLRPIGCFELAEVGFQRGVGFVLTATELFDLVHHCCGCRAVWSTTPFLISR